jgi:hypothetical protein
MSTWGKGVQNDERLCFMARDSELEHNRYEKYSDAAVEIETTHQIRARKNVIRIVHLRREKPETCP